MIRVFRYCPDDYIDLGVAGEALLEITARIELGGFGPLEPVRTSCSIVSAKAKLLDGQIIDITKRAQGLYEDDITQSFLKARDKEYEAV